jgi:hypothetical protein
VIFCKLVGFLGKLGDFGQKSVFLAVFGGQVGIGMGCTYSLFLNHKDTKITKGTQRFLLSVEL